MAHLVALGVAAWFYFGARVVIVEAFRAEGTQLPLLAAVTTTRWFLPVASAVGAALSLATVVLPVRKTRRAAVAAMGLVVTGFAVILAALSGIAAALSP